MSNRKQHKASSLHVVERAQGLDPEITAQPRSIPDELALEASSEPELSVDPDDLGSHFLREATAQGDFDPEQGWPGESSSYEVPEVGPAPRLAADPVAFDDRGTHTRMAAQAPQPRSNGRRVRRSARASKLRAPGLLRATLRRIAEMLRSLANRLQHYAP